jgi:hypothetical protein
MVRPRNRPILVALAVLYGGAANAIDHKGLSRSDEFLVCAGMLLGKPVFREAAVFRGPGPELDLPCPSTRAALLKELKGSGVASVSPEEIKLFEMPERVFLMPFRLWVSASWKHLLITTTVSDWATIPGSRNPSKSEREAIAKAVLRDARTIPLVAPSVPDTGTDTATMSLSMLIDVRTLAKGRAESVVALLYQHGGVGRLVYGEIHNGKYRAIWDSPLFLTASPKMGYRDVDGDGVEDVVLGNASGEREYRKERLIVWTSQGHELTRQRLCDVDLGLSRGYTRDGGACPITAETIDFDPPAPATGRADIIAQGRIEDRTIEAAEKPYRYRLVNRRYAVVDQAGERGKDCSDTEPSN